MTMLCMGAAAPGARSQQHTRPHTFCPVSKGRQATGVSDTVLSREHGNVSPGHHGSSGGEETSESCRRHRTVPGPGGFPTGHSGLTFRTSVWKFLPLRGVVGGPL